MEIQITGKHIDLGDALTQSITEKLEEGVTKYSENPIDAKVVMSKDGHEFLCDVSVHLSTGLRANSRGRAGDVYASADDAIDRMETQLRRYKRRLKNHHKDREAPIEAFAEKSYVLEAGSDETESNESSDNPIIVAETETKVQSLSVGEAVMQMELAEEQMLVFRNTSHGGVNVVYRREDGNIGWVDPRRNT